MDPEIKTDDGAGADSWADHHRMHTQKVAEELADIKAQMLRADNLAEVKAANARLIDLLGRDL